MTPSLLGVLVVVVFSLPLLAFLATPRTKRTALQAMCRTLPRCPSASRQGHCSRSSREHRGSDFYAE